jgi:hypothetical protein
MWPIPGSFIDKVHKKNEINTHNDTRELKISESEARGPEKSILHKLSEHIHYGITLGFGSSVGDKCINYLFPKPYPIQSLKYIDYSSTTNCETIKELKLYPEFLKHHYLIDIMYQECIKTKFNKSI